MFIGPDGVPLPQMSEITEPPVELTTEESESAARLLSGLLPDLGFDRVAFLLCRPGRSRPTAIDQRDASALYAACREVRLPVEVIHLATDVDIWPIPYDAAVECVA